MKLQNMIVIFAIIIIPVTLILSAYIQNQIDTAVLMQTYDTKLMDATHDAVVAFQLNTLNNDYSTNADSIRRDIKAAVTTFTNSLAAGFGMSGASQGIITPYIPALVFTLYDGYYIYSPVETTYEENGEKKTKYEHILKPYIYYSVRYRSGSSDIVVNYSLDNYISIYGYVAGTGYVAKAGYLIDLNKVVKRANTEIVTGYKVTSDYTLDLTQKEKIKEQDENKKITITESDNAQKYYQEAYEFTSWLQSQTIIMDVVRPSNAVKSDGSNFAEFTSNSTAILRTSSNNDPENLEAEFNQHKREVMKQSINENLGNAIAAYNKNTEKSASFTLPQLTDQDWEKLLTDVNMISFMQGLPVGSTIYNNYSIVTSTKNKQFVSGDALYFTDDTEYYHHINCPDINTNNSIIGYKAVDFEKIRYTITNSLGESEIRYYYRHSELSCYTCIVNTLDNALDINLLSNKQKQAYYMALARSRYELDKVTKILK